MRGALLLSGVGLLILLLLPEQQMQRFRESGTDTTSTLRLTYWKDGIEIANRFPLTGVGYQSWLPYYQTFYNPQGQVQHNIFIQALSEMGYPGLLLFLSLIGVTFYLNAQTRRCMRRLAPNTNFIASMSNGLDGALVGYLVSGFFVTVLFYPYFWVNLAMTAALHNVARKQLRATMSSNPRRPLGGAIT